MRPGILRFVALFAVALGGGYALTRKRKAPTTMSSEKKIESLDPSIQSYARDFLNAASGAGISLVITDGYRSLDEQARLYAQGRTAPGPIVTHAPPGSSWHNFGLAFDVAVLHDGKATWPNDLALWQRIGDLGKSVGLEWGGDFPTKETDRPHFQRPAGLTLAQARNGERPPTDSDTEPPNAVA